MLKDIGKIFLITILCMLAVPIILVLLPVLLALFLLILSVIIQFAVIVGAIFSSILLAVI